MNKPKTDSTENHDKFIEEMVQGKNEIINENQRETKLIKLLEKILITNDIILKKQDRLQKRIQIFEQALRDTLTIIDGLHSSVLRLMSTQHTLPTPTLPTPTLPTQPIQVNYCIENPQIVCSYSEDQEMLL